MSTERANEPSNSNSNGASSNPSRRRSRGRRSRGGGGSGSGGGGGGGNRTPGNSGGSNKQQNAKRDYFPSDDELAEEEAAAEDNGQEKIFVPELKALTMEELTGFADERSIENAAGMRKADLLFAILQAQTAKGGQIFAEGVLEILQDGFGFLRASFTPQLCDYQLIVCHPACVLLLRSQAGLLLLQHLLFLLQAAL